MSTSCPLLVSFLSMNEIDSSKNNNNSNSNSNGNGRRVLVTNNTYQLDGELTKSLTALLNKSFIRFTQGIFFLS